jgi:hypothetical protein
LQSLSSVPATSHFVAAGTLADFGRMWNEANQQLPAILNTEQMDRWNKIQQFMKVILNFDVQKDLLAPLGNEFAFSYATASEREMQPGKMNYYVALQLKDTEKFRALIQRVETLQWVRNLQKQQETYSGKKIEVFRLQQGTFDMSPSYLFDASWFYFASSPAFLKQSIDAQSKQGGILSVPDFKKVSAGFPDSVNGISYTNVPAYLRMYSAILKKKENGSDQFLRGSGLEEEMNYLSPYLFGAATYSVMEKDGIFFRSYASIPSSLLSLLPTLSNLPRYVGSLPR